MKVRLKQNLSTKLKTRLVLITATSGILGAVLFFIFFGYFNSGFQQEVTATTTKKFQSQDSKTSKREGFSKSQNASAQPVTLLSFTVKAFQQNQVLVNWVTASEKDNNYFTIERSTDGINFSFLKSVKSKGDARNTQYYSMIDEVPFTGISYYKLSHSDLNGANEELKKVKVEIKQSRPVTRITAWPNPFKSQVVIGIPVGISENATVKMMDLNGKIIFEKPVQIDSNQSEIHIESLDNIPAGNYILKVYLDNEISEGVRLVKY